MATHYKINQFRVDCVPCPDSKGLLGKGGRDSCSHRLLKGRRGLHVTIREFKKNQKLSFINPDQYGL